LTTRLLWNCQIEYSYHTGIRIENYHLEALVTRLAFIQSDSKPQTIGDGSPEMAPKSYKFPTNANALYVFALPAI
jgi:hypothetical protein